MNGEHAFNAAKSMASELAAYVMAVAQKYGKQEAFDLLFSTFDQYGRRIGNMLKQQLEGKEANVHNIYDVVVPMFAVQGFELEDRRKCKRHHCEGPEMSVIRGLSGSRSAC